MRILIIEDNPDIAANLGDYLDEKGHSVDFAGVESSGPAAKPSTPNFAPTLAARPLWLDAAIADAQSVQGTTQLGKAPPKVEGQPWITEAIGPFASPFTP